MPYSSFTLDEVEKNFKLQLQSGYFLPTLLPTTPSGLLQQNLLATLPLAQETGSEKARSKFIMVTIDIEEYGLSPVDRILQYPKVDGSRRQQLTLPPFSKHPNFQNVHRCY